MFFAQRLRLRLLQIYEGRDVYGPDVLANILILAGLPYSFYIFGINALMGMFLLNATLNLLFYYSATRAVTSEDKLSDAVIDLLNKLIPVLLLIPVFFQLTGNIFHDPSLSFDSGGILKRLPIPVSVIACYTGILILGNYRR